MIDKIFVGQKVQLVFTARDSDGIVFPIDTMTPTITIKRKNGAKYSYTLADNEVTLVTDGSDGKIMFASEAPSIFDTAGIWNIQCIFTVSVTNDEYPASIATLEVEPRL